MTDEGQMGTPLDPIEMVHAMKGMAEGLWTMFSELIDKGFTAEQAMKLTMTWLSATIGGGTTKP